MGPSGSGKSTLMNIIGCLDKPTTGTYELAGQNISNMTETELAHVRNKERSDSYSKTSCYYRDLQRFKM